MALIKKVLYINEDIPSSDFTEQMQDDVINEYSKKYPNMVLKVYGFFTQDKNLLIFTDNNGSSILGVPKMLKSSSISSININSLTDSMIQTYEFIITSDSILASYQDALDIAQEKADSLFKNDNQRIPIINIIDYKFGNNLSIVSSSEFGETDDNGNIVPLLGTTPDTVEFSGGNPSQGKEKLEAIKNREVLYFDFNPTDFKRLTNFRFDYSNEEIHVDDASFNTSEILEDGSIVVAYNIYEDNRVIINTINSKNNNDVLKSQTIQLNDVYGAGLYVSSNSNFIAIQEYGNNSKFYNNRVIILKKDSDGEYIEDSILEWDYDGGDELIENPPKWIKIDNNGLNFYYTTHSYSPKLYKRDNINTPFDRETYNHPENYASIEYSRRNSYTNKVIIGDSIISLKAEDHIKMSARKKIINYDISDRDVRSLADPKGYVHLYNVNDVNLTNITQENSFTYYTPDLKNFVVHAYEYSSGYKQVVNYLVTFKYNEDTRYYEITNFVRYESDRSGIVDWNITNDKSIIPIFSKNSTFVGTIQMYQLI